MKKRYKILFGTLALAVIIVASIVVSGSVFLMSWEGGQTVVNENRTLEKYAKNQMDSILSSSKALLKDGSNLTAEQRLEIDRISDAAAKYIWEFQTRVESDYSTMDEIKASH